MQVNQQLTSKNVRKKGCKELQNEVCRNSTRNYTSMHAKNSLQEKQQGTRPDQMRKETSSNYSRKCTREVARNQEEKMQKVAIDQLAELVIKVAKRLARKYERKLARN